MESSQLVPVFQSARRSADLAVLEGFHALKHAVRFGADLVSVATRDSGALRDLVAGLAPDIAARVESLAVAVSDEVFARLCPTPPPTGVAAVARRRVSDAGDILAEAATAPVVFLEDPRHLGNIGAVIRVAAAAGAAGVICSGTADPWDASAIRGAAGLQYALPVARVADLGVTDRPVAAIDPDGELLAPGSVPPRAVLAFGSERSGLSEAMLRRADCRLRIPMAQGVSSLNLATSVAVLLYAG